MGSGVAGISPPRDLPPLPGGEIPSDLALPGVPFLRFRSSNFLYIIGIKNNGGKIGNFDTCTNYSRCSQRNTLISCRTVRARFD